MHFYISCRVKQYCIGMIAPLATGSYRQDGENYSRLDMSHASVHCGPPRSLIIIAARREAKTRVQYTQ